MNTRTLALIAVILGVAGVLLAAAAAGPAAAGDVTDIGATHPVADNTSIDTYDREGYVEGDLTRYQMSVAVAEDGSDVGLPESIARDTRNDYVRIQYNESHARTVRILLPRAYMTPYTMETVDAMNTDHVASYNPARDGDYLAITIHFDGEADVVLPLQKDSSASYSIVEYADDRIKQVTGFSPLGRSGEWSYIDGEDVAEEPSYALNNTDGALIQYDAKPDKTEEVWINAPRGETEKDDVYYFERESDNQIYIVSATDREPDVRVKHEYRRTDRWRGDANEVGLVADRIRDGDWLDIPFFGGD